MKNYLKLIGSVASLGLLLCSVAVRADEKAVTIVPPDAKYHGKTYGECAAAFWQYAFALPVEGHPFAAGPNDDFSAGQSGSVWFWSAPEGPMTRTVRMPAGKALFLTIRDVDVSSLEAEPFFGATEAEQREKATRYADLIESVFVTINGVPVTNLEEFRFSTPQFEFTAPTPWIFGETGGTGTAVGDGYFLMLELPKGHHTIHYGGTFRFAPGELFPDYLEEIVLEKDITIELTVGEE
ncbi:MAG TPA: hypothetical protein VF773_16335 [Verrucomicrobiae bacterium]